MKFLPILLCLFLAIASAQPQQPGTKWTEDQLKQAVAPSRAGRKLTPKAWPGNARVAVCLSFDVDNESYLLAAGQTSPTTLSAADFGAQSDYRASSIFSIATTCLRHFSFRQSARSFTRK